MTVEPEPDAPERTRAVLEERARRLAEPRLGEAPSNRTIDLVHFTVGEERYALPTACVRRVAAISPLASLPGIPEFYLGLINLSGLAMPLVDVARLLGAVPAEMTAVTRVVVCGYDHAEFGLAADSVTGVEPISLDAFERAHAAADELVRGVSADALVLIDGDALLRDARLFAGRRTDAGPDHEENR